MSQVVPSPVEPNLNEPPPLPPAPGDLEKSPPEFSTVANRLPSVYQGNDIVANTTKSEPLSPSGNNLTNIQPQTEPVVPPPPPRSVSFSNSDLLSDAKKHYFGRGAELDLNRAFVMFSQSAEQGNAESARYLGIMYLRGKGVSKDSQKALEWFTIAADGG